MILFPERSAATFELLGDTSPSDWPSTKNSAVALLTYRGQDEAARFLERTPFALCMGTNDFHDDFLVLHAFLDLETYARLTPRTRDGASIRTLDSRPAQIADVLSELGSHVRFVAVDLDVSDAPMVSARSTRTASDELHALLRDAEELLRLGPERAVDRLHTAFHTYLQLVAQSRGIEVSNPSSVTSLFKDLRESLPRLTDNDVKRLTSSLATIVDTVNTWRNLRSPAHPQEELLEGAEARLALNAVRTLMTYLDDILPHEPQGFDT